MENIEEMAWSATLFVTFLLFGLVSLTKKIVNTALVLIHYCSIVYYYYIYIYIYILYIMTGINVRNMRADLCCLHGKEI